MSGHDPPPGSIAQPHLCAVLRSLVPASMERVRLLDVGCGDGRLIAAIVRALKKDRPDLDVQPYGYDVSDSGVQEAGFIERTVELLERELGAFDWRERIRLIRSEDPWPYADGAFDFVVSNHVLEHVVDHPHVFREIQRVLADGGVSVHLFPLKQYLYEAHARLPFLHWIRDYDRMIRFIRLGAHLGLTRYREHRGREPGLTLDDYAHRRADYMLHFTNYLSKGEVLGLSKRYGLRCSFRYTEHFYFRKIRALLGWPAQERLKPVEPGVLHDLFMFVLPWVSSVTVVLEKKQTSREPGPA